MHCSCVWGAGEVEMRGVVLFITLAAPDHLAGGAVPARLASISATTCWECSPLPATCLPIKCDYLSKYCLELMCYGQLQKALWSCTSGSSRGLTSLATTMPITVDANVGRLTKRVTSSHRERRCGACARDCINCIHTSPSLTAGHAVLSAGCSVHHGLIINLTTFV